MLTWTGGEPSRGLREAMWQRVSIRSGSVRTNMATSMRSLALRSSWMSRRRISGLGVKPMTSGAVRRSSLSVLLLCAQTGS